MANIQQNVFQALASPVVKETVALTESTQRRRIEPLAEMFIHQTDIKDALLREFGSRMAIDAASRLENDPPLLDFFRR